jgi:WD40 repeat protein
MRDGSSKTLLDGAFMFNSVAFSPRGRYVFSGNEDCFLRIWDTRTGKLVEKWKGHEGLVSCLTLSKDGKLLVSGGGDMTLKYWDVTSYADCGLTSTGSMVSTSIVGNKDTLRFEGHTVRFSPPPPLQTLLLNLNPTGTGTN